MTHNRRKILFFSPISVPFMELDREILAGFSHVIDIRTKGILGAIRLLWAALFVDAVFSWFASTYSALLVFAARLLGKKCVVIVGGADVTVQEDLGYGLLTVPWKRSLIRYALRRATAVAPMSLHLETLARKVGKYQGNNLRTIPPGLDDLYWTPEHTKEPVVLAVAACPTPKRVKVKGIDVLIEAARLMPGASIRIVGVDETVLRSMDIHIPSNVVVRPWLPEEQLLDLYRRSRVCCQPSRIESFSFALAQGMLCECIPVASRVGGLPEVMGEVGFLVPPGEPESLATALAKALKADGDLGRTAREHIRSSFSLDARAAQLTKLFEG
ncbi:MAG: glycosyltransferase family 4 protein [Fidelibacterota bacterium]